MVLDGRYELIERLDGGGFADVWLARHLLGGFECAVKLMKIKRQSLDICREEFRLLSMIHHPNIVRTFEMGYIEDSEQTYLAMELIRGRTWTDLGADQVTPPQAVRWLRDLVGVLRMLHGSSPAPIVHKDIKPPNIMVAGEMVKLIDFNLASRESVEVGSYYYRSPLVAERGYWEPWDDLWSLALSFYELVCQVRAFSEVAPRLCDPGAKPKMTVPSAIWSSVLAILNGEGREGVEPDDYYRLFSLPTEWDSRDPLPDALADALGVSTKHQKLILRHMLADQSPRTLRSRQVLAREVLHSCGLPAAADQIERLAKVFPSLERLHLVTIGGKRRSKATLTPYLLERVKAYQESGVIAEATSSCA